VKKAMRVVSDKYHEELRRVAEAWLAGAGE